MYIYIYIYTYTPPMLVLLVMMMAGKCDKAVCLTRLTPTYASATANITITAASYVQRHSLHWWRRVGHQEARRWRQYRCCRDRKRRRWAAATIGVVACCGSRGCRCCSRTTGRHTNQRGRVKQLQSIQLQKCYTL